MDGGAPHERLRQARTACGEELSALSRRTGVRLPHLRAIEDGRFSDLPPGIYARAAVRAFADAYHLDTAAVLAACEPDLPVVADPIGALARKCGVPSAPVTTVAADARVDSDVDGRMLLAAAIDGAAVGVLVLIIAGLAALVGRVPIGALNGSAVPFALLGVLLAGVYFMWFGGICGATAGVIVAHAPSRPWQAEPLTLRAMSEGALSAATADVRTIVSLGACVGRWRVRPGASGRSAPRLAPALSRLRSLDLWPARWSPANRPDAGPLPPPHRPRG